MSFPFNICKMKAKHSGQFLKSRKCIKRASAPSKGEVFHVQYRCPEQSRSVPNKDTPPSPFSQAAEVPGSETPTATGVMELRVGAQARPGDTRGRPPLTPGAPRSRLTPSEQLQGTLCRESPQVDQDGFAVPTSEGLQADMSAQQHPPRNDFHVVATAPCFKHSCRSNAESRCFIHGSSTKSCPKSQHPRGSQPSAHRAGKAKAPFSSQGIKSSKSKVSWVRKLQSRLNKHILNIRAGPRPSKATTRGRAVLILQLQFDGCKITARNLSVQEQRKS